MGRGGSPRPSPGLGAVCLPEWRGVCQRPGLMRRWLQDILEFTRILRRLRPQMRPGRVLFAVTVGLALAGFVLDLGASGLMLQLLRVLDPKPVSVTLSPELATNVVQSLGPNGTTGTLPPALAAQLAGQLSKVPPGPFVDQLNKLPAGWHGLRDYLAGFTTTELALLLCACALLLAIGKNVLLYASAQSAARMKRRSATNLRISLFRRLLHVDLALFESRKSGEVAEVFHQETFRAVIMLDYLLMLIQRLCMVAVYLAAIIAISWQLSIATLLLAASVAAVISVFYSRLKRLSETLVKLHLRAAGRLGEMFAGIRVIRSTHSEARELRNFEELAGEVAVVEEQVTRGQGLMVPLAETGIITCGLMIVGGAYWLLVQRGLLSTMELFFFCVALARLLPALPQIYGVYGQAISLAGGLKELLHWLELPPFPQREFGAVEFTGVQSVLRFEKLTYRYPNSSHAALQDFSLEVPAGKTVALVGASGSGKSTAASLLLRFREPTEGRISVDGRDYWEFSPESWHRRVAVVEQEAFLFHESIRNNLTYGFPEAREADVQRAVAAAQLDDAIQQKESGLDTVVGERGVSLSGGQRQRLAIARALVRDPRLLILDEATSALDNVKERQVQAALDAARHGRTVVVIAHRLTTIRHSDKIVVLDRGRVVEEGTWDELLARKGTFARLVQAAEADHKETL